MLMGRPRQTLDVVDRSHPSTKKLPERWAIEDEMYDLILAWEAS
jgi:hypothetical protein